MSSKLWIAGILVILLTLAGVIVRQSPVAEISQSTSAKEPTQPTPDRISTVTDARAPLIVAPMPSSEITTPDSAERRPTVQKRSTKIATPVTPPTDKPATPGSPANAKPSKKKPLTVPDARVALVLVGVDPDADEYWRQTINDPLVPAKERSDLIEDLNEVGIDSKNLTLADVPLIESRLELIERMAPDAMDQVNADAFAEAHKDLTNMLKKVSMN